MSITVRWVPESRLSSTKWASCFCETAVSPPQMTWCLALGESQVRLAKLTPNMWAHFIGVAMSRSGSTREAPITLSRCSMTEPSGAPPPRWPVLPLPRKNEMDSGPNSSV